MKMANNADCIDEDIVSGIDDRRDILALTPMIQRSRLLLITANRQKSPKNDETKMAKPSSSKMVENN